MKHGWKSLVAIGFCVALAGAQADKPNFRKKSYKNQKGTTLPYRLLEPRNYDPKKKYPLVLFLHGSGSRGNDNEKQMGDAVRQFASAGNRKQHPCFVVVPQCPASAYWAPLVSTGIVAELLDTVEKQYSIDPERIYVTGLSDGGWGVWALIAMQPKRFAAALPICGRGNPGTAAQIAEIPVWVFHGARDKVEPVKSSRDMVAALKKAGGTPRYTEYKDEGHAVWDKTYKNAKVLQWLFDQKRK